MSKEELVCVDPDKIEEMWPHVSHFLQAAMWTGLGDDTIDSMKYDLDQKRALLWVVWDGRGLLAAAVTKVFNFPSQRVCLIAACGGRELSRWKRFISDLEDYARKESCDIMRIHGRHGWKAVFSDYREPWVALEKGLR